MKPKQIITFVLTIFVLISVGTVIFNETVPAPSTSTNEQSDVKEHPTEIAPSHQVIVYYFHGNVRCVTCRTIEEYTNEALMYGFSEAIQDGCLIWLVVNVDKPENEHFVKDYQLHTKSVVLSEMLNGQEMNWKNLNQVWDLVGDKDAFITYIKKQTSDLLGESND